MAKLPQLKARQVIKVLETIGFERTRQSGSHAIFKHPDGRRTTVSVHPTKTIPTGTLRRIIEDSGLTEEEFLKLI
jgi:predicted RNA binding protein YcfA (HicA-like mRNA interferase family)